MLEYLPVKLERERLRREALHKVCLYCGNEFTANKVNQKYCSEECAYQFSLRKSREHWAENYKSREFICAECGKKITTSVGKRNKVYCSTNCLKRAERRKWKTKREKQMKRAFVETVTLDSIYAEANGVCGICGLPVPNTTEPDNPWGVTLDHIKPLSKGGLHIKSNCQLAHRMCNSLKNDCIDEFRIDWKEKCKQEPGRWSKQIDELWEQVNINVYSF